MTTKHFYQRMWSALVVSLLLAALHGCVSPVTMRMEIDPQQLKEETDRQHAIALESLMFDQMRLHRVAYPILKTAADYTDDRVRPYIGLYYANRYSFSDTFKETAEEHYGLGDDLTVLDVIPGGPADEAGIIKDDVMLRLNGMALPRGEDAPEKIGDILRDNLVPDEVAVLTVLRNGQPMDITIIPDVVADYRLMLSGNHSVNAKATGKKVIINRGMMRFTETDNELAFVISHEISHNVMRHVRAVMINYTLGTVVDVAAASVGIITGNAVGAAAAYSKAPAFESEADYVGLYLMARAGLPIDNAAQFWRRIAAIDPGSISKRFPSTHPPSPERFIALEQTITEIKSKAELGLPLEPEIRYKFREDKDY